MEESARSEEFWDTLHDVVMMKLMCISCILLHEIQPKVYVIMDLVVMVIVDEQNGTGRWAVVCWVDSFDAVDGGN